MYKHLLVPALLLLFAAACHAADIPTSPNSKLTLTTQGGGFIVACQGITALDVAQVGFASPAPAFDLAFQRKVTDDYTMLAGKRRHCHNEANEYAADLRPGLRLVVRLYNDGLAFRYELSDLDGTMPQEQTAFRIPEGTRRWLLHWTEGYEDFYPLTATARDLDPWPYFDTRYDRHRWGFPALIESRPTPLPLPVREGSSHHLTADEGENDPQQVYTPLPTREGQGGGSFFVLLTEANIERQQSAVSLYSDDQSDLYRLVADKNDAQPTGAWHTPWRVAIIGSLAEVVESTLVTDVSEPCRLDDTSWIRPGVVSWIYWAYNHGSNDYNIIKKYVDMAAALHLPYVLIDAEWDEMRDGKTIDDAIAYARSRGVKPLIWYNSSVGWIDGAPGPKFRLNKAEDREREFAWCERMGVAGVKIDFFSGDTQANMDYCLDLLESAARHHLLVNFHGAPIPRGWQRTYPNLLSTEGVYGAEWYNNVPTFTSRAARHNATLPFTRNVIGPMDYTPCTFSDSQHPHTTTHAHELALTILYESGLQHLADRPESYLAQPHDVQQMLSTLPAAWDETRYVSGYPGESAVLARRSGTTWYVAGINGRDEAQTLPTPLDFLRGQHGDVMVFTDNGERSFDIHLSGDLPESMECMPRGGFVLVVHPKPDHRTHNMPLFQTKYTADPAPLVVGDTLFLYTSHDASPEDIPDENERNAAGFFMYDWLLWSTTDMVNWTEHGAVASLKDFSWRSRDNGAWAIQTVERNGKYYLYAPLHGHGIGVLTADSPYGPFRDTLGRPLVWDQSNWYDIDPTVFTDTDGQAYMYWGNPHTFYVKLGDDMTSTVGPVTKLPPIEHYQEGPWFYKRGSSYYLAYASTCCPEALGYAMSDSPTGPWEPKGYIMRPTQRDRGNHPGICDYKGRTYVFGQDYDLMHLDTYVHHERRSISAAEITYAPDGTIAEIPYWLNQEPLRQLQWLDPYRRVEAETMAWGRGLKTAKMGIPNTGVVADMPASTGRRNMYVYDIDDGEYIKLRGVDFGKKGARRFAITAAATGSCTVTLRLDAPDGEVIGTADISPTSSLDTYRDFTAKVRNARGVHDLYLCFGNPTAPVRLDCWRFER